MSSAATQVRGRLKTILSTEFSTESFPVKDDKLHPSLGENKSLAAVYPEVEEENTDDVNMQETTVIVQVFKGWNKQVDPGQEVDPSDIEAWADRFRVAVKTQSGINDPTAWYFRVTRIEYPPDPTGNITRFEATVKAFGCNSSQV